MSLNRTASSLTPLFLRVAARHSRTFPVPLSRRHPALTILAIRRSQHTDTSTSSGSGGNFPPPGFNAEQAKKPINRSEQSKEAIDAQQSNHLQSLQSSDNPTKVQQNDISVIPQAKAEEAQALNELAAEKATADKEVAEKKELKKKEEKKLTLWQKVKREVAHYRDGTKLLATEIKISFKLALKMGGGYELTRREHRQLQRTVQDLGRLVPFSVFVIVPFAELLLPVALKLFPNLLPSTYEGQKAKDAKATSLRSTRKEVSTFLRNTLKETGLPVSAANAQKEEFVEFFRKVRTTGEAPTAADVIKVCKIFKDDLTLDNLSRPQLVGMCRYMNLNTFGTDAILRYQIRHRMRQIKRDDRAIAYEGVESLSVTELQMACASRGIRTQGMSPGRLRDDMQMWLDLRLKYGVPSTLLVLSNAFVYAQGKETDITNQIDALQAVLASVPEELFHEIELEVHTAEGAATNKQRLEVLKEQQELIEEENEQNQESGGGKSSPKDDEDIDEKEERRADIQAEEAREAKDNSEEAEAKAGVKTEVEGEATRDAEKNEMKEAEQDAEKADRVEKSDPIPEPKKDEKSA